jgi:phosphoglycerate kinase
MKSLEDVSVNDKRVLLRIDTNVPVTDTKEIHVADDFRLRAVVPTIQFLLNRKAKVILLGHLGRPDGPNPAESLRPVFHHLSALVNQPIKFAPKLFSPETARAVDDLKAGEILGLENLRFDPGEAKNSRTFARKLAGYGDIYINDAFAVSHRDAASVVAITEFLPSYPGILLELEYKTLTELMRHPARPFVAVIGGAKIGDKLPVLQHLLPRADRILIGGGVATTFLAAQGEEVGQSLVDRDQIETARLLLKKARGKIILPIDLVWHDDAILDIGPKTAALFGQHLKVAKTIFWNGNLGKTEVAEFARGSAAIAKIVAASQATTIVGGGNTIEIFSKLGLLKKVTFVATGGGASLELLSAAVLPGIAALQ